MPAKVFSKKFGAARPYAAEQMKMAELDRQRRSVLQTQITIHDEESEKRNEADRVNASGKN
ncbi:hypothetical protein [Burkholderia lata]|uniref:hypothetical protein n=1 Tax=Burkholderia lata (strain ATCC 17760 / DSM 23089 / LMG 22485 / NCIMB 9086 / R18194 / 383) TaxID=482957 RepID=UPI0015822898|nr:hypothetical protein [Burkholderia lata]